MTLLITILAAIICTLVWYQSKSAREMKIGLLCYMFWGAGLMWLCDAVFEYAELGAKYFTPLQSDMLNDSFLGLCEIVLALAVWIVVVLIKDPKGTLKETLQMRN